MLKTGRDPTFGRLATADADTNQGSLAQDSRPRLARAVSTCLCRPPMPRLRYSPCLAVALRVLMAAAVAAVAAPLAGCHDFGDVTGSISGSTAADGRDETQGLRRRLRQALRAQSRREDRLDRICPGVAGAHPLQRGGRGHPDGGHQSPEGFRCARRIRQGAGRRWSTGAGQGRADARRYARRSAMGRHVGARHSRRSAGRSRERDAILSRRAEDLAGRAGRARPTWGSRWRWRSNCPRPSRR